VRPIAALTREEARRLRGVLFDLDDTVLSHGVLGRGAYDALWRLREAGLGLAAVTGRPAGWGELLARQWPIDCAITENGAVVLERDAHGVVVRRERCSPEERRERSVRLGSIVDAARIGVPEARLTDDAALRVSDVTWDVGEHERLPEDRIAALLAVIHDAGARTSRSSVHVHATFETDDKASGAVRWLVGRGVDAGAALATWAFVGDSPNDAACFAAFRTTFGVANVARWVPHMTLPPRWVAPSAMGEGFAEIVRRLVELR